MLEQAPVTERAERPWHTTTHLGGRGRNAGSDSRRIRDVQAVGADTYYLDDFEMSLPHRPELPIPVVES